MPTQAVGNSANVPATRDDVTITVPLDGDPRSASSVNTPLQRLADYAQRIVKSAGFLDIASAWTTLQTFTRRIVVEKAGGDANPALTVTGGAAVDTLATDTFTSDEMTTTALTATNATVSETATVAILDAATITTGAWVSGGGGGSAGTFGSQWQNTDLGTAPLAFRITPWGTIEFRGVVTPQNGAGTTIFTLPNTHLPTATRYGLLPRLSNATERLLIEVAPSGAVTVTGGTPTTGASYVFDCVSISV